jgi:hypothetical protein
MAPVPPLPADPRKGKVSRWRNCSLRTRALWGALSGISTIEMRAWGIVQRGPPKSAVVGVGLAPVGYDDT